MILFSCAVRFSIIRTVLRYCAIAIVGFLLSAQKHEKRRECPSMQVWFQHTVYDFAAWKPGGEGGRQVDKVLAIGSETRCHHTFHYMQLQPKPWHTIFCLILFLDYLGMQSWKQKKTVKCKEYISVIEGTAPPFVFQTFNSPNLSPLCLQYTALPARLRRDFLTLKSWVKLSLSHYLPSCPGRGGVNSTQMLEDEGRCCPF